MPEECKEVVPLTMEINDEMDAWAHVIEQDVKQTFQQMIKLFVDYAESNKLYVRNRKACVNLPKNYLI